MLIYNNFKCNYRYLLKKFKLIIHEEKIFQQFHCFKYFDSVISFNIEFLQYSI